MRVHLGRFSTTAAPELEQRHNHHLDQLREANAPDASSSLRAELCLGGSTYTLVEVRRAPIGNRPCRAIICASCHL